MGSGKKNRNSGRERVFIPYEKEQKGPGWIGIIIMLSVFWPVGAYMLAKKIHAMWHNKKIIDYRNYAAIISDRYEVEVREFSAKMGKTPALVMGDLQKMIDKGYLGSSAYIDRSRGVLILDALESGYVDDDRVVNVKIDFEELKDSARRMAGVVKEEVRRTGVSESIKAEFRRAFDTDAARVKEEIHEEPEKLRESKAESERSSASFAEADDFEAKLREIRHLNDEIDDEAVSTRIDRIGELTLSIFTVVRQKPERADEVRKFMNYYLPTTFKLLKSYSLMEKQSYQGENIVASRKKIEDILDTLITAFEQQQDRLFRTEALDVEADIQVLETMMAKDGLVTPKGMNLRAMGGRK